MKIGFKKKKSKIYTISILLVGVLLVFGVVHSIKKIYTTTQNTAGDSHTLITQGKGYLLAAAGLDKGAAQGGLLLANMVLKEPLVQNRVESFLDYIQDPSPFTQKILKQNFSSFSIVQKLATYKEDILSLLGFKEVQNYLVVLQNRSEKRPNGGFFGSFALVTLDKGEITNLEVIDSYLPNFDKPNTSIMGPKRLEEFLPDRTIHFIGANKVGFTYHDGAHIKTLYEKSYPGQKIRGVVFLRTDMFEELIPGFTQQIRERQFVNASIDLIRGGKKRGKKEYYLEGSQKYFEDNGETLVKNLLKNLDSIIERKLINIYLTDISGPFHGVIRRNNLTTRFESETGYFRDSNISFNKVDRFVDKKILCSQSETIHIETKQEIVSLVSLKPGNYSCQITYHLSVPQNYTNYIAELEEKYEIELGEREEHILVLDPERKTRGIVYLPQNVDIIELSGDIFQEEIFKTPFAHAASYQSRIGNNNTTNTVTIRFTIN